jgi:hypothetical protein
MKVSIKSGKNNGHYTWPVYLFDVCRSVLLVMRNVSDKSYRENQNTRFICNNFFFSPENRSVYEIMWKNIAEPVKPQMTIWRMSIARCVPKATDTLRIRNTYCFFTTTMVALKQLNLTCYRYCLSCWSSLSHWYSPDFVYMTKGVWGWYK